MTVLDMRWSRWNTVAIVLVTVLLTISTIPAPVSGMLVTQPSEHSPGVAKLNDHTGQLSTSSSVVVENVSWELISNDHGTVRLTYSYELPANVDSLELAFAKRHDTGYQGVTPVSTNNLDNATPTDESYFLYKWNQNQYQGNPEITVEVSLPRSVYDNERGGIRGHDWALAVKPEDAVNWEHSGQEPELRKEQSVVGEGYASDKGFVFLGEHEVYTAEAEEEQIELVVPKVADPKSSPEAILSNLVQASNALNIGGTSETVTGFVFPSQANKHVGGREYGETFFVGGNAPISSSIWYHEYVHTRQEFWTDYNSAWLVEASADYFGHVLQLNLGHIDYQEFYSQMYEHKASGTLSKPDTWTERNGISVTNYEKGRQALAATNQKLRRSPGETTISDIFYKLNRNHKSIDNSEFVSLLDAHTQGDYSVWSRTHIMGSNRPTPVLDKHIFTLDSLTDPDNDGLRNTAERDAGTNPFDADTDNDGVDDLTELNVGTNPLDPDTDGDGVNDGEVIQQSGQTAALDTDQDGVSDSTEQKIGTDPTVADTDGDGLSDGTEREIGTDPLLNDTDGDGLSDGTEIDIRTSPLLKDTDWDGLNDSEETNSDPTKADTDNDGLSDLEEIKNGTNPGSADTDGDGYTDKQELKIGTDPRVHTTLPEIYIQILQTKFEEQFGVILKQPIEYLRS